MFSSRIFSFFFLLATVGLFAFASPVAIGDGLAVRSDALATTDVVSRSADLVTRGSTCNTQGCNENQILTILLDLKVKIDLAVALLDGHHDPYGPCNDIIVAINAAIQLLLKVSVNVSIKGDVAAQIVQLLLGIIASIVGGVGKYGLLVLLTITLQLDICLSGLVNTVVGLIPGLLGVISGLVGGVLGLVSGLLHLKLVLTAVACGAL